MLWYVLFHSKTAVNVDCMYYSNYIGRAWIEPMIAIWTSHIVIFFKFKRWRRPFCSEMESILLGYTYLIINNDFILGHAVKKKSQITWSKRANKKRVLMRYNTIIYSPVAYIITIVHVEYILQNVYGKIKSYSQKKGDTRSTNK
jgi:hypothetical protein